MEQNFQYSTTHLFWNTDSDGAYIDVLPINQIQSFDLQTDTEVIVKKQSNPKLLTIIWSSGIKYQASLVS